MSINAIAVLTILCVCENVDYTEKISLQQNSNSSVKMFGYSERLRCIFLLIVSLKVLFTFQEEFGPEEGDDESEDGMTVELPMDGRSIHRQQVLQSLDLRT